MATPLSDAPADPRRGDDINADIPAEASAGAQAAIGPAPRLVLLFSGHMIDAPDRATPRFPADKEPLAQAAIAGVLDALQPGPGDIALCGGACGGDLLFAEAALARGVALELYLPFDEATFLSKSVDFAGGAWHARYDAARAASTLHVLPQARGPLPDGANAYELNNLWMLERASRFGAGMLHFVCLWDGRGGDGPGGTEHLMQAVQRAHGHTHWLDTTRLWH